MNHGLVGMDEWVRVVDGGVGCYWARRFSIILRIVVTVKRFASSNKHCMAGEHHGPNICVQHHLPPTIIS